MKYSTSSRPVIGEPLISLTIRLSGLRTELTKSRTWILKSSSMSEIHLNCTSHYKSNISIKSSIKCKLTGSNTWIKYTNFYLSCTIWKRPMANPQVFHQSADARQRLVRDVASGSILSSQNILEDESSAAATQCAALH